MVGVAPLGDGILRPMDTVSHTISSLQDEDVRTACMAHLSVLVAEFGEDIPYAGGLARGFPFRGARVPFLNRQKGIYRAAVQSGPAALAIQTSANSPYDDEIAPDGFLYAYRAGPIDQHDNRALRAAHELQVPLVYFIGTRPGWYKPVFPVFVSADDPARRMVLVTPGVQRGPLDEPLPVPLEDPIERRYAVRETRVRLHQARFRESAPRCGGGALEARFEDSLRLTHGRLKAGPGGGPVLRSGMGCGRRPLVAVRREPLAIGMGSRETR